MSDRRGAICLAAFRPASELFRTQLESIRAQTVTGWTCLVGFDGEDPRGAELARSIVGFDERFVIIEFAERVGFYRNFERVLGLVPDGTDWVALADQDDKWDHDKLERLVPQLASASLAFCQARVVRRGDDVTQSVTNRTAVDLGSLFLDNQVTGSLSVFRAGLLEVALPFPGRTEVAFHDHWLGVCASVSGGLVASSETLQDYVQHDDNVIGESAPSGLGTRVANVPGHGLRARLAYISEQRWGWRVHMAQTLLERVPTLDGSTRPIVEAFAADRMSITLARLALARVVRGAAPFMRTIALLAGAAYAPRLGRTGNL